MNEAVSEFLNVRQTAALLGVHENTVRNWVKSGVLVSSRVPGASAHRFSREYIERVARERGESKSVAAPSFCTIGPELARAVDIDRWGATLDAKGAFPDLIRRLLVSTPGVTNLEMRTHEGVAAPGWDGAATSTGAVVLPDGPLLFELGTDARPKQKAQSDYDKRVPPTAEDSGATLVFATPRNWAGGQDWAIQRARDGHFAGVRVLDAHSIEAWLLTAPAVHYWLSERLGYRPRDAYTITTWWDRFSSRTNPRLPESFFLAGRESESDMLAGFLSAGSNAEPITISAPWPDEVIAFVYAATADVEHARERIVVVQDDTAWQRILESREQLVLIPLHRDSLDLAAAIDRGHQVILPAGTDDIVRGDRHIALPRIGRVEGAAALRKVTDEDVGSLVALARRSMPALFRRIGRESRYQLPPWAEQSDTAAVIAPLISAGSWTSSDGDQEVIERLTGVPKAQIERLLSSLATKPDPPFVRSGGSWTLASPVEAALSLLPKLTSDQYRVWSEVALEVLLEADPYDGMGSFERMQAQASGIRPPTSETLKRGMANALALAAVTSEDLPTFRIELEIGRIVHRILTEASTRGGTGWAVLSASLPALAEAAPDIFLDAVDDDLSAADPKLAALFQDKSADFWGPSSPHPSLLWALELLCWSPTYFSRSASMLAKLTRIDPGGRLSNRPADSLASVELGWLVNSGASVDDKIEFARQLCERDPEVGWKLSIALLPARHAVASPPQKPKHRDWTASNESVTWADWGRFIEAITALAVDTAGLNADRWRDLIPRIDELPRAFRDTVLDALEQAAHASVWSQSERTSIWRTIETETLQHREFSTSQWAMPEEHVQRLEAIASGIEPADDPERFVSAFGWRTPIPDVPRSTDEYRIARDRLQREAVDAVLPQGIEALTKLALAVDDARSLGAALGARSDAPGDELLDWLDSEQQNLAQVAMAFVGRRIAENGLSGLERILDSGHVETERAQINALGMLPFGRAEWEWASTLTDSLQDRYWRSVRPFQVEPDELEDALRLLCERGRPWQALELLSSSLTNEPKPKISIVEYVVDALVMTHEPLTDHQMTSYHLEQALTFLEQETPDHPRLPLFEFTFFELLHDHRPSAALYRLLNADPAEFVALVSMVYRGENEPAGDPSAHDQARAHLSWSVLHEWSAIPGAQPDGTIDGDHLTTWVRAARLAFSESARTSIGDEVIGEILATSPIGADGAWPAEPVREIVESVGSARLDTGLAIGRFNQRGIHSRDLFDGGAQERTLEETYRAWSTQTTSRWPRTARILRGMAEDYAREAEHHDADSERRSDEG
ncbi:helix-turn-helix domain-containing protein [Microbacterium laevaniformans]|uniref:helix-turn-helix domain-containing protein n=1 Tax=Microbacterium laevaniformans TaxID=36807 RepID=UPI00362FD542